MRRAAIGCAAAALAALASCSPGEEGPLMLPGEDCMICHGSGGGEGKAWTYAGTVFGSLEGGLGAGIHGVQVRLVDANGKAITAWTNEAGNFYSAEKFAPPYSVTLSRAGRSRTGLPDAGSGAHLDTASCNGCHVGTARLVTP